jgi:hypothetical protein
MATLIEKLEKWRGERRVAEESKAVQKTEQLEALRHRAKELELYLQRVGVQQVGFKMTSDTGQIILQHELSNQDVLINVGSKDYTLWTQKRSSHGGAKKTVKSPDEVEAYIFEFLKAQDS